MKGAINSSSRLVSIQGPFKNGRSYNVYGVRVTQLDLLVRCFWLCKTGARNLFGRRARTCVQCVSAHLRRSYTPVKCKCVQPMKSPLLCNPELYCRVLERPSFDPISLLNQITSLHRLSLRCILIFSFHILLCGSRVSSVSIVSDYGLDDRAIGVRPPAGAKGFFL
jgi:hypothetical protein